ncbi:hypothetical protein D3C72_1608490 [compost metagenome]
MLSEYSSKAVGISIYNMPSPTLGRITIPLSSVRSAHSSSCKYVIFSIDAGVNAINSIMSEVKQALGTVSFSAPSLSSIKGTRKLDGEIS